MKLKLGAEPKKVAILGVLVVFAVYMLISNSSTDVSSRNNPGTAGTKSVRPATASKASLPDSQLPSAPAAGPRAATASAQRNPRGGVQRNLQEFRPTLKAKRPEDRPDPMTIDPTLRTDALTKLQAIRVEGVHRSLFEFGSAPPPPPTAAQVAALKAKNVPNPLAAAPVNPPPPSGPPPTPPPPPIPLKFYGFINVASQGPKRAFFLEGEDIHVVTEGDTVKRRYRIVRIGVNSVVVEDTQYKNQQTLPLEEQPTG
jgi:hypothetical protein